MDAVELPYPVDVTVPQLMVSEGFGRAGVTVKGVEGCESDGVAVLLSRCSSSTSQKGDVIMSDVPSCVHALESAMLDKIPDTKNGRNSCKFPSFQDEHASEQVHCRGSNCLPSTTRPDCAQLHQSSTKISKIGTLCSMKEGTTQLESTSLAGVDDLKDIHDRPESRPSKYTSSEKNQLVKQKNNLHSKRSEKRCPRVPAKSKYDSFAVKAGSASIGSASGGSNFHGLYGLKSDAPDVTKLIDDFSLIGLLDGTYEAPDLGKDKAKKETNTNESLLHSVRKAGSVLEPLRPIQAQKFSEIDSSSYKKLSTCISTTVSCGANGDREETCITDPATSYKNQVSSSKLETRGDVLDFPLYQPKDVLERLTLPPPKDLESLLLDAAKPTISSRNTTDPRSAKQVTHRPSLPPFPWSYTFSGQSRSNADTIKLSSSRNTCQGRWVRIGHIADAHGVANDCFPNLDSLKYENNLIPSEYKIEPCMSGGIPWFELGSSSSAPRSKASYLPLESGEGAKHEGNDDSCPRILAAAQTLIDMAALYARQNKDGLATWQKKASQKTSRARKARVSEKGLENLKPPIPFLGSDNLSRSADQGFLSKKPKLSTTEEKKDPSVGKGSVNWSTPKSVRSSPSKSERDSSTNVLKLSSMMPPPARVLERKETYTFKQTYMLPPPARASDKPEQKRKAMDSEERPRNSAITSWNSRITKQSLVMSPSSRIVEKTRDSEHKLKKLMVDSETKHSFTHTARQPGRAPEKGGEVEQKRKACDGEERPRKLPVDKTRDWRNLDKIMDWK